MVKIIMFHCKNSYKNMISKIYYIIKIPKNYDWGINFYMNN
jgi:hypothetical protein